MTEKTLVTATVNDESVQFLCEPHQSLLECLRDVMRLTGPKEGCNDGNCGACSVLLNGRMVNSCLVLGVEIAGQAVTTLEGLATWQGLHPSQQEDIKLGISGNLCRCTGYDKIVRAVRAAAVRLAQDRQGEST